MSPPPITKAEAAAALGAVVRLHRKRAGLTQEGLAERAGISTKHAAHVERGERSVTVYVLRQIAGALGTPLAQLVTEMDDRLGTQAG